MENLVNFRAGLQEEYDSLQVKDNNTLYFIIDTHRIYKGALLFGSGLVENLQQKETIELYGGKAVVESVGE